MKNRISELAKAYQKMRAEFNLPETRDRKIHNVAVRAAFCFQMRETKIFTYEDIGAAVIFKGSKGMESMHHATVIHLVKRVNDGFYNGVYGFDEAMKAANLLAMDIIGIDADMEEEISSIKENFVIKELTRRENDLKKRIEMLTVENKSLLLRNKRVEEAVRRIKSIRLWVLKEEIRTRSSKLEALGYEPISTQRLSHLENEIEKI